MTEAAKAERQAILKSLKVEIERGQASGPGIPAEILFDRLRDRVGGIAGDGEDRRSGIHPERSRLYEQPMTLRIRPASPDDIATILRFIRELAAFEKEPDAVEADEAMLHEALFGAHPAAEALIAEQQGAGAGPIGFALFYATFSTWTGRRGIWLEDLYVTPEARGGGAGSALLRALAAIAVDRGCARFEWAVLDWNSPAVDFYRAKGAVPLDEWTVQRVTGDALLRLAGRG